MSEYKTLKEWFGNAKRGDGRKFRHICFEEGKFFEPIFLDCEGQWVGVDELNECSFYDEDEGDFTIFVPPKKTKSILMYSPVRKSPTKGHHWYFVGESWNTRKDNFHSGSSGEIVGWMTCHAEVEDDT